MAKKIETIKKIKVRGFKSIMDEQEIELRPLTLLAGANSSGKSSIMQPILLLKQTIEAPFDPGALLLDGPNVKFTRADQLFSQVPGFVAKKFSIYVELSLGSSINLVYQRGKKTGIDITEMEFVNEEGRIQITPDLSNEEIIEIIPQPFKSLFDQLQNPKSSNHLQWIVTRERGFLAFTISQGHARATFSNINVSPNKEFTKEIKRVIHLPGLRGNPSRTYQKSAVGLEYPGTFDEYVASIVASWKDNGDSKLYELGFALEEMGLTWKVTADRVDDTQVELKVGRLPHSRRGGAHDLVSIADVGFGVSQVLPVVVALIVANPGQVVYLEQPEIHLHPRAQRKLAHVINNAVKRNVVVVVETHSALLLREIQTLVAKGELSPEKVALHWFQRQEDGRTVVNSAELDENGAYGPWPEDFDEVELEAEKDYLDAVESREVLE